MRDSRPLLLLVTVGSLLGLTANIVNTTVGAGIFALPAAVSLQLGAAAPIAFIICAAVSDVRATFT